MSERGELSYIAPKEHAFRKRLETLRGAWARADDIGRQRIREQIDKEVAAKEFTNDPRNDGMLEAELEFLKETE
ncbi:hypothetical protein K0A96_01885 [Patescibacteria group bacterium]|nr:hypothetical protein [Patescibacteria group bacterium]